VKDTLQRIQFYSVNADRKEKSRKRRRDLESAAAGKAGELQAANRLISNPKEWELEAEAERVRE
jgi:hypothetical protein